MQRIRNIILLGFMIQFLSINMHAQLKSFSDENLNKKFEQKTFEKITDLERNIVSIIDKSIDVELRKNYIDVACELFESEDKIIETQDKKSGIRKSRSIRSYFNSLLRLNYDHVSIEWVETKWQSNFQKAPDGKYYGTVRVVQVYKGQNENAEGIYEVKYEDSTEKDIEVQIEIVEQEIDGEVLSYLIVLLGNVKVESIR